MEWIEWNGMDDGMETPDQATPSFMFSLFLTPWLFTSRHRFSGLFHESGQYGGSWSQLNKSLAFASHAMVAK